MNLLRKVVIFASVISVFFILECTSYNLPPDAMLLDGNLSEVQKKAIDLLVDLTKLFITFSYGIIGGLAYFLKESPETPAIQSRYQAFLVGGSGVMAVGCIYFGHIILTVLVDMLSNDLLELRSGIIVRSYRHQYICLIISVLFLVAYTVERHLIKNQPTTQT